MSTPSLFLRTTSVALIFLLSVASDSTVSADKGTTTVNQPLSTAYNHQSSSSDNLLHPSTPIVGPAYYVAPYGNDSRSKSQAADPSTPWRTLQKAADNVVPGDTVVVKDGVYKDDFSASRFIDIRASGTAQNPIRFVSENKWGAVLDAEYVSRAVINIRAVSHVIIEGFEIRHGENGGIIENWSPGSSYITIRGNWIHNNANHRKSGPCGSGDEMGGRKGIYSSQHSRYWVAENNIIHTNGRLPGGCPEHDDKHDHGWYMQGHGHVAKNNIFFDHTAGWDIKVDGSIVGAFPQDERSAVVINNTFASHNPNGRGQLNFYRNRDAHPRNVLIMNNVFWNSNGNPIRVGGGGWPWYGAEVVGNITDRPDIIRYERTTDASQFYRLQDNIVNASGNMGMQSPKSAGAAEDDFRIANSASVLVNSGKAAWSRTGLPKANAPAKDYIGRNRPQGFTHDLGAFEWTQ